MFRSSDPYDSPLWRDIVAQIATCGIGFVDPEPMSSLGSGTLVRLGELFGVLTCSHVASVLNKRERVGLNSFTIRPGQPQFTTVQSQLLEVHHLASPPWDSANGPDLAFIRLPMTLLGEIASRSSILNLDNQIAQRAMTPPEATCRDLLLGVV